MAAIGTLRVNLSSAFNFIASEGDISTENDPANSANEWSKTQTYPLANEHRSYLVTPRKGAIVRSIRSSYFFLSN